MRITIKDKFAVKDKVDKLSILPLNQALKLLYGWVKQDVIDYGVFKMLYEFLKTK